jgi:transposase InsO family protein
MDIHQNARLTPYSREQLAKSVLLQGRTLNSAAAEFKVSSKTARKWVRRYQAESRDGMPDRSSRPHRLRRPTSPAVVERVEQLRRQRFTGVHIAQQTGLSRATVSRILRRLGIHRLRDLQPAPPVLRYELPHPGDLLHLDIKQLSRFHAVAFRPDGRRRGVSPGAGWAHLHVAIDDHSRLAFALILPDQTAASAITFLRAALDYYAQLGILVRRLLTDNGYGYRSRAFAAACHQLQLRHSFTRPYTPRTNGKAERFIQTALREWAYAQAYPHSDVRDAQLPHWLHHYNWHRLHASLNHAPPISRSGLDGNNLLRHHS